ncbi:MAG: type II secretion system protein [Rhizomicrobium sp.]
MNSAPSQSGFTLVETLVALAILGLSMAVLLTVMSDNLDRTRRARDEAVAAALAQSVLARAEAGTPQPGTTGGAFAGGYSWRVAVEPYLPGGEAMNWPVGAVTIAATVSWHDGGAVRRRTLTTYRVIPKATAP